MPILLVRHAKAGSRRQWDEDDRLRPLTEAGWAQARALVDVLAGYRPQRLLSSPYVRCVQTLEPLGRACRLDVEEADALAEGRSAKSRQLIGDLVDCAVAGTVAVCTHGDIVPEVLRLVADRDGVDLGFDVRWAKASTWVLEHGNGRFGKAIYLPPPA